MSKIDKTGLYEISSEEYHGDCCVGPSLSASGCVTIEDECPRVFWDGSYLNPDREEEDKKAFSLGTCAHLIFLEPHLIDSKVSVIDADDYRTKAAKEMRDDATKAGLVPVLKSQFQDIKAMRNELMKHHVAGLAFKNGKPEQTYIWQDEETGVWCKARPDWVPNSAKYLIDYKTSTTANPDVFMRNAPKLGYYQKAAWQIEGIERVTGARPDQFWFVLQSVSRPYLPTVFRLQADDPMIPLYHAKNAEARRKFAKAVKDGYWPGYSPKGSSLETAFDIKLPAWTEKQLREDYQTTEGE